MSAKKKYQSFGGYGVDIASKRIDDLDRCALSYLRALDNPRALDVGCGAGGMSFRMSEAGADVLALDIADFSSLFTEYTSVYSDVQKTPEFRLCDVSDADSLPLDSHFDCVLMQRTLHYLEYHKAVSLLHKLRTFCQGKLFISVSGMESDISNYYVAGAENITDRFDTLSSKGADKFSITKPVCLYRKSEFEALLEDTGWRIEEIWTSAFGNHKAICL